MPVRKSSQRVQQHNETAYPTALDATSASPNSKPLSPQSTPQQKTKKAAWLDAPLPQFYDQELAAEMVRQGYYKTLDEALIEVSESHLKNIQTKVNEYLITCKPSRLWLKGLLPSPNK